MMFIFTLLAGCNPEPVAEPTPPSILLITLDTTRADRLGPYGYIHAQTPTYDQLAIEGTTFLRAYSSCPLTIPSHSTILSGLYPPTHGVRDNGDFVLSNDTVLISERLREAGYRTAAFTSAFPTQARWGFDQGFDVYHDPLERNPTRLDWSDQRRAGEVIDDALDQLAQWSGEEPVFFWVHLFDAHWPYDPPEPYRTRFITGPYDGEIAYTDAQVGRLLAAWDDKQGADSVVMVTADHGEGLGDGGEQTHGFLLHDGTTRVPLILRGPGVVAGAIEDDVVGLVDITPTLLGLAGLPLHDGIQGTDLLTGGSRAIYSEALTGQFNLGLAPLYSLTGPEGRYMEGGHGAWYRAFSSHQISTIPDEEALTEPHRETLGVLRAEMDEVVAPAAALTAGDLAMLQALGYIGGDITAEAGDVDPRDVIDIIPLTWQVRQLVGQRRFEQANARLDVLKERMPDTFGVDLLEAQFYQARGLFSEAYARFTDLYLRAPSSTIALQLAALEEAHGDFEQALSWYDEAQSLQPASPEAMEGRVRMLLAMDRPAEATAVAGETLQTYPDHSRVRLASAQLLISEHRLAEARIEATTALKQIPWNPTARQILAEIHWDLGESDEAIDTLRDALTLEPYSVPRRMLLTTWFLEVGRSAEAVRTITPLSRALPEDQVVADLLQRADDALQAELAR